MTVDFLPVHLIIVGGRYIGLEFGQMYRRFGASRKQKSKEPAAAGAGAPRRRHATPSRAQFSPV